MPKASLGRCTKSSKKNPNCSAGLVSVLRPPERRLLLLSLGAQRPPVTPRRTELVAAASGPGGEDRGAAKGAPRNTCAGPVRQVLRRGQAHAVWGDLVHPASSSRRRMHNTPAVPAWPDVPGPCEADVAGPPGSRPHGSTGSPRGMRTARGGPAPFVCRVALLCRNGNRPGRWSVSFVQVETRRSRT